MDVIIPPVKGSEPEIASLYFRRQDTSLEEAREMLDSALRSVGIHIPGLNPDSLANIFSIPVTVPPDAKPPDR